MSTVAINKTIYLVESKVEFAATIGAFPASIESIECSDDSAIVEPTNVQQIKLYKYYTEAVGVDTITVKITLTTSVQTRIKNFCNGYEQLKELEYLL